MSELTMYVLYFIYYGFPLVFIILVFLTWKRKSLVRGTSYFGRGREKDSSKTMKNKMKDIRTFQVALVIFILLFVPLAHYSFTTLSDGMMDRNRIVRGQTTIIEEPVEDQIGPSSDTEGVIEEMKEEYSPWIIDGIKEEIDFDEITRIPGKLGVYYLERSLGEGVREHNIIITYSYFSPIPITRVYGFEVLPGNGEEQGDIWLEEGPNTVIYPMDPANADPL